MNWTKTERKVFSMVQPWLGSIDLHVIIISFKFSEKKTITKEPNIFLIDNLVAPNRSKILKIFWFVTIKLLPKPTPLWQFWFRSKVCLGMFDYQPVLRDRHQHPDESHHQQPFLKLEKIKNSFWTILLIFSVVGILNSHKYL